MPKSSKTERARHKSFLNHPYSLFEEKKFAEAGEESFKKLKKLREENASPYYRAKAHQLIARCIIEELKVEKNDDEERAQRHFQAAKSRLMTANTLFGKTERLDKENVFVNSCKEQLKEVEAVEVMLTLG